MPRRNDAGRDDCCGKQYDAALLSSSLQQRVAATAVNARLPLCVARATQHTVAGTIYKW
jgi:hypothetical protein